MTQALVTIIAPIAVDRVPEAEAAIDVLGNPARPDIQTALGAATDGQSTHFASLHAIRSADGARGHIVLEFSADGTEDAAVRRIASAIGESLRAVFMIASDWSSGPDLADYLLKHRVAVGSGWFANPGVVFAGTPGTTVGRIRRERDLAKEVVDLLRPQPKHLTAMERLQHVRDGIADKTCLQPAEPTPPFDPPSTVELLLQLALPFVATFLWPVGVAVLLWGLIAGATAPHLHGSGSFLAAFGWGLWHGLLLAVLATIVLAAATYLTLRRAEANDWIDERAADRATNAAMFHRENHCAQNHMISICQRKPGVVRAITLRLIFWVIGQFAARLYRPGFLSDIGTIHFARWVTPPGSPDLLFVSNYGGSWESYLEDFITRAHLGLTGVWSNCIGFPRTTNLVQDGATDGERFKRFARRSMQPTRFWFSAYPTLTTAEIRTNAEIRRGLSGALTEDEAMRWLALFGSAARPAEKLASNEIQSLVFGGLGFLNFGTCLILELPEELARARAWLHRIRGHVAFDDGRRLDAPAVVTLALGAPGLARLGLPEEGLRTFPFAFLEGMATESRARMLGDTGADAPSQWSWGQAQPAAALLVYGRSEEAVASLEASLTKVGDELGASLVRKIPLKEITPNKKEPFGFVDGISQPIIRGTHKGLRNADAINLVAPGEFILGYPDNRDNMPPGPVLPATADPMNMLPLVQRPDCFDRTVVEELRDVGCNGSFLVIRQLEQDVAEFERYCTGEAARLAGRLPPPYKVDAKFVAAKLIGRWQDGSSLVRHPYEPLEHDIKKKRHDAAKQTARPTTHPEDAAPIERPAKAQVFNDNDFLFGVEDPEALRCPFGAHIRRSNPRESLDPGSDEQIAITNRHRIIRVGRQYAPAPEGGNRGLLFMCLNGDIERQFEFVQQTWLQSPTFHGLSREKDPLIGTGEPGDAGMTIPSREGPMELSPPPKPFVRMLGGGYFFLPGKRLLDYLCA